MKARAVRKPARQQEIGWREDVGLPDLEIESLRAKIDTGARTSALHAVDIEVREEDGGAWASFHVPLADRLTHHWHVARIVDRRWIKNTSGVPERRYVIRTTLVLGMRHWHIEVSLADRGQMGFDLILGRTAVRGRRLLVNPGKSFLAGPPRLRRAVGTTNVQVGSAARDGRSEVV